MTAISIDELHEHTERWVRKAAEQGAILLTDNGRTVAKIVPVLGTSIGNPFLTRTLVPGFANLQETLVGGTDSAAIVSEMRDGR